MYICSVAETYFFQFHNHYPKIIYWTCLFSHSLKTLLTYFWRTKYTCSGYRTPLFWLLSFYIWHPVEYPFPLFFSEIFWQFLCIFSSRWTLDSTCQVLLKIPLGFWLEVHWIYRLIWGELTSLHYWIFPSKNMVCLSISSGVLLYPSVKF